MKFQYSPGLFGYGAKGTDGSDGLQGMALYFTDYDTIFNLQTIENAIKNDYVLLSSVAPGTKLPGNRQYISGDLFIDSQGIVYVIDASEDEFSEVGALNKNAYFTKGVATGNFWRYYNSYDISSKEGYIIDNNLSLDSNYNIVPSKIYGIELKDFTRIEFTDINTSINAFSIYSIGANPTTDNHMALAIIRDSNGFRIGNINDSIRNTNLIFDISLLQLKKEDGNRFSIDTPSGTILTNAEKNTHLLFDPNFEDEPAKFINFESISDTTIKINWNLLDFTSDTSIYGNLHFSKSASTAISYDYLTNVSTGRSMIFHDVEASGNVIIDGLIKDGKYEYFMTLIKDGWERCSKRVTAIAGGEPFYMYVKSPSDKIMTAISPTAGYLGYVDYPFDSYIPAVEVSTFVLSTWDVSVGTNTWITLSNLRDSVPIPFGDGSIGDYLFDVSLSVNLSSIPRSGNITFTSPGVPSNTISVTQGFKQIWAYFDNAGYLQFTPSLTDQTVSVSMKIYAWAKAKEHGAGYRQVHVTTNVYKGGILWDNIVINQYVNGGVLDLSINKTTALNVTASNVNITVNPNDCQYDNTLDLEYTMGWVELTNITKISGTGSIDISTNKIWYQKKTWTTTPKCILVSGALSTQPLMPAFP